MQRPDTQTPFGAAGRNAAAATASDVRSDADLAAHEEAIALAAGALVASHPHVALSYSGGAESGLLLHLLRPMRERFTLIWVNPGALPHEAEHVRRQAEGGPFVEVPGEREAFWEKHGLPSSIVPVWQMTANAGDAPMAGPPIAPAPACCFAVRTQPGNAWAAANGVTLLIHGQRMGEGTALFQAGAIGQWGPLARWSRAEVMRRVAVHGVPLPVQYAEGYAETFECAVCPANLDPARLAFLRRRYPAEHAEVLWRAGEAHDAVAAAWKATRAAFKAAQAGAPAK